MKKVMVSIVSAVCAISYAAMQDDAAIEALRFAYLAEISIDTPPLPPHMTATNMSFEVAYSNLLNRTGWTALYHLFRFLPNRWYYFVLCPIRDLSS